jgi:hypothetical protein
LLDGKSRSNQSLICLQQVRANLFGFAAAGKGRGSV